MKERHSPMMAIGQLSKQSGCSIDMIRYYEREGLIPKAARSEGGHRLYRKEHLPRVIFVRHCRHLGFPLSEVKSLTTRFDNKQFTCAEVKQLLTEHLHKVRQSITQLRHLETSLKTLADQCSGAELPECAALESLTQSHGQSLEPLQLEVSSNARKRGSSATT